MSPGEEMPARGNGLPDWDTLVAHFVRLAGDHGGVAFMQKICKRPPGRPVPAVLRVAARFLTRGIRVPDYEARLADRWNDIMDLGSEQVARNVHFAERARTIPPEDLASDGVESGSFFRPNFHQLPCSRFHRRERALAVRDLVDVTRPVLLLGDDDLLSLELARLGFRDITVVDIDAAVIDRVRARSAGEGFTVNARVHDLTEPPPADLKREYALVFMDPPCNPEGVLLFFAGALRFCDPPHAAKYFLCTHTLAHFAAGLGRLNAFFAEHRLRVVESRLAYCVYPLSPGLAWIVHMLRHALMLVFRRENASIPADTAPRFFISDAYVLEADPPPVGQ